MIVLAVGYGVPLFGAQLGHYLRDWIAVEVEGYRKPQGSIEYSFAVASERFEHPFVSQRSFRHLSLEPYSTDTART